MLLVGDIGGTKTLLAAAETSGGRPALLIREAFASAEYDGMESLVHTFIERHPLPFTQAVFAIAGPVDDQRCQATNLPWLIEASALSNGLRIPRVKLLNDLEATAHAVPYLDDGDLRKLSDIAPDKRGLISVLAPGTGLGEAFLIPCAEGYRAYPSEGGHTDLAPTCREDADLLEWLMRQFDHVSYERACSGMGTAAIYRFLKETGRCEEPARLREKLEAVSDPVPVIDRLSRGDESYEICRRTMDIFIRLLGAKAGNIALSMLPTGGLYLGGGIPPRMIDTLEDGRFMAAFRQKGRVSAVLDKIPVRVIMKNDTALLGSAWYGIES